MLLSEIYAIQSLIENIILIIEIYSCCNYIYFYIISQLYYSLSNRQSYPLLINVIIFEYCHIKTTSK